MFLALHLLMLSSSSVADEAAMAEIERLDRRISELGDLEAFADRVATSIANDDCRSLVPYIAQNSIYKSDPEHFYTSCVYNSRRFANLSAYSIRRRTHAIVNADRSPPFMPKIVVDYLDGDRLEIGLDLSESDFRIIELAFYPAKNAKKFYPPWVRLERTQ
ncbi:MAG: hypothetical protein AAF662_09870 [Pseudomonadota bacterium]